jgi:alkylated DNA repair dioxygenase AlkB
MARSVRAAASPEGFIYHEAFITPSEQSALVLEIEKLPLKEFEFHGYLGKRRTISFGWHYSFESETIGRTETIPGFLLPVRCRAAAFAEVAPEDLPHVLVTEYSPGTPIGWHRDKAVFADVIGISLLSSCPFRLRRKTVNGWERFTQLLAPRSAYLIGGEARQLWEHSIPPVEHLRYSITFRSLRK